MAGTGRIRTGDLVVWLKPVAVTPAVVHRDGQVQAVGDPADRARRGLAEDLLDELYGSAGTIDEIARQRVLEGSLRFGEANFHVWSDRQSGPLVARRDRRSVERSAHLQADSLPGWARGLGMEVR